MTPIGYGPSLNNYCCKILHILVLLKCLDILKVNVFNIKSAIELVSFHDYLANGCGSEFQFTVKSC
jgi:hypothetical protein